MLEQRSRVRGTAWVKQVRPLQSAVCSWQFATCLTCSGWCFRNIRASFSGFSEMEPSLSPEDFQPMFGRFSADSLAQGRKEFLGCMWLQAWREDADVQATAEGECGEGWSGGEGWPVAGLGMEVAYGGCGGLLSKAIARCFIPYLSGSRKIVSMFL